MDSNKEEPTALYKYKFIYQDIDTNEEIPGVDWLTLTLAEYDTYVVSYINTGVYGFQNDFFGDDYALVSESFDKATEDEMEAYNEGWIEASMLAKANERWETYNGVAYRLDEMFPEMVTTKVFTCGSCDRQFDFTEVAKFREFYVVASKPSSNKEKEDVLWHVCKGCAND